MISSAVPSEFISRIVGYIVTKGFFSESSPNLPMRVAILGEANTANQGGLDLNPFEATTLEGLGMIR